MGTGVRRWGFEFKCADAPKLTRSVLTALDELELRHVWIVHPGRETYDLHDRVTVTGLAGLAPALRRVTGKPS